MTTKNEVFRFEPQGLLAIDPQAFGLDFAMFMAPATPFELVANGKAAVVRVDGPLQTAGFFCDTYGAIRQRVAAALASEAEIVILKVASPGGDVFGCFDTSRSLRAMAAAAGKRLVGYTEANACSSAYALISACEEISASSSSVLGSIGVIATAVDATAQAAAQGLKFAIITSGARKADGNPMASLSKDAVAAMQSSVDAMAGVFFDLVKDHRGIDAAALEAATFVGQAALEAGLCDRIESFDSLVARAATGDMGATLTKTDAKSAKASDMPNDTDDKKDKPDARKALAAAAESDDPKEKARAARALKAWDEKDDEKAEDDKPEPKDEKKAKAKAEDDEKEAKAKALALATPAAASADPLASRVAQLEATTRKALYATRPDLPKAFFEACDKLSIESVEEVLAAAPKPVKASAEALTGAPAVAPTRGNTQGAKPGDAHVADRLPREEAQALDDAMGTTEWVPGGVRVEADGLTQTFGGLVRKGS